MESQESQPRVSRFAEDLSGAHVADDGSFAVTEMALNPRPREATSSARSEMSNALECPVPTNANPTEAMAQRFLDWRKVVKDLIGYFREAMAANEGRIKALQKTLGAASSLSMPPGFLEEAGMEEAMKLVRIQNRRALADAQRAKVVYEDLVMNLTTLRADIMLKVKEIRGVQSDFRNSMEKCMEVTRKSIGVLGETLHQFARNPASTTGKNDPFLVRLSLERHIAKQLFEENYIHQAHRNLEASGRQLESVLVVEIKKAFLAYTSVLRSEFDTAADTVRELEEGPLAMDLTLEWGHFVRNCSALVDPDIPLRHAEMIRYPGKDHFACQIIREGPLERKTKYLKSYCPGWYVLTATHIHEFKSAEKTQPLISLYLPDQVLGKFSTTAAEYKMHGVQVGSSMHRRHKWTFRAEDQETMMGWYRDIETLKEIGPDENKFYAIRRNGPGSAVHSDTSLPFAASASGIRPTSTTSTVSRTDSALGMDKKSPQKTNFEPAATQPVPEADALSSVKESQPADESFASPGTNLATGPAAGLAAGPSAGLVPAPSNTIQRSASVATPRSPAVLVKRTRSAKSVASARHTPGEIPPS